MILIASDRRKFSYILLFFIIGIFATIDWNYFTHPAKIPFRDLASYVKSTRSAGDFIINEDVGNHKLWESKYYGIPAPIYNPGGIIPPFFVGTALMEKSDLITSIPKNAFRLGVITYKSGGDLEPEFKGYQVLEEKKFGSLNFVWMKMLNNCLVVLDRFGKTLADRNFRLPT